MLEVIRLLSPLRIRKDTFESLLNDLSLSELFIIFNQYSTLLNYLFHFSPIFFKETAQVLSLEFFYKLYMKEAINKKLLIEQLSAENSNFTVNLGEILDQYQGLTISKRGIYYPYNHEHLDIGWGCAWRAIQTLLSTQEIYYNFASLYSSFSEKRILLSILKQKASFSNETIKQLQRIEWSPQEIECHWAQPFIASIICHSLNLPHVLYLLNGPVKSYAPKEVFSKIINFQQLCCLIIKNIDKSSLMIDDGYYALSIIGVRELYQPYRVQFLFADPHIRSNRNSKTVGIYRKTFDINGNGVTQDQTQIQKQQALYDVYQKIEFFMKNWMICMIFD